MPNDSTTNTSNTSQKIRGKISNSRKKLRKILSMDYSPHPPYTLIKDYLIEAATGYEELVKAKLEFKQKVFADKDDICYRACQLLYKANRSDEVPDFFKRCIPTLVQRITELSRQHAAGAAGSTGRRILAANAFPSPFPDYGQGNAFADFAAILVLQKLTNSNYLN